MSALLSAGKRMKFATKPHNSAHLLWHVSLKNYKFKFSADIQQI